MQQSARCFKNKSLIMFQCSESAREQIENGNTMVSIFLFFSCIKVRKLIMGLKMIITTS